MIGPRVSANENPSPTTLQPVSRDHRRIIKWILFVAFVVTVPVPFYMLVVVGLIPTAAVALMTLRGLVTAFLKFTYEAFVMVAIMGAEVVIPGGLLYLMAGGLARFLCWALSKRYALLMAAIIVVSLMTVSCFEIYRLPGHNWMRPASLAGVIRASTQY